jgi:hypothetical protein
MAEAGSTFLTIRSFENDTPRLLVAEAWYETSFRHKELLIEAAARAWFKAREEAGFSGDEVRKRIVFEDSSGNQIGEWSVLWGTKVHR